MLKKPRQEWQQSSGKESRDDENNFEGSGRHICPGNDSPGN